MSSRNMSNINHSRIIMGFQTNFDKTRQMLISKSLETGIEQILIEVDKKRKKKIKIAEKKNPEGDYQGIFDKYYDSMSKLRQSVYQLIKEKTRSSSQENAPTNIEMQVKVEGTKRVSSENFDGSIDEKIRFYIKTSSIIKNEYTTGFGSSINGISFNGLDSLNDNMVNKLAIESLNSAIDESKQFLNIKRIRMRSSNVILGNQATGLLFFKILTRYIHNNSKIAIETPIDDLIIIDDPNIENAFGSYYFDDFTEKPSSFVFFDKENGDWANKQKLGNFNYGRYRSPTIYQHPRVCFSNINAIGKGMSVSELLNSEEGIYVTKCKDIQLIRDEIKIFPEIAYYNSEGKKTPIGSIVLREKLSKMLNNIEYVCNDTKNVFTPIKSLLSDKIVPMSFSAPHIKINDS